jgi:hypothetical protein
MSLIPATAYTPVRAATPKAARAVPHVVVKKPKPDIQWLEKELRTGGMFDRYVEAERHKIDGAIRNVARRWYGYKPSFNNAKCKDLEVRVEAAIPARLYHRMIQMDPDFWKDPANLRRLKADNPDMAIFV